MGGKPRVRGRSAWLGHFMATKNALGVGRRPGSGSKELLYNFDRTKGL